MSAFFLVIDIVLAAITLRFVLPQIDEQTSSLVVVIGVVVVAWKWMRDFAEY